MAQTTQQFNNSILLGSAKIEVGDDVASLTNLGLMNGVGMAESWTKLELTAQNGGVYKTYVTDHRLSVSATALEVHPDAFEAIRGSIDTWTTVAGTLQSGVEQTVAAGYTYDKAILFENQNGDGSAITVASVVQDPGGADTALAEGTDYELFFNSEGEYCISFTDTATVDNAESILITYSYTPSASKTLVAKGTVQIPFKVVRLTHESADGQVVTVTIPYASVDAPLELTFVDDNAPTEPISYNISFVGTADPSSDEVYTMAFEGF